MERVIIQVKDMNRIRELEDIGVIVYKSPILNIIAIEVENKLIKRLNGYENVLKYEIESEGNLMPMH